MNKSRCAKLGISLIGLGWAVVGCQAPGTPLGSCKPTRQIRPAAKAPPQSLVHNSSGKASVSAQPGSAVLAGIQPADSLRACRPLDGSQQISLTRFLEEIEPQTKPAEAESPKNSQNQAQQQFTIPKELPGSDVSPLPLPEFDPNVPFEEYRKKIQKAYTKLPELPPLPFSPADAMGDRMSLGELQEIAYANSPLLAAAAARVEQARGEAIQAGLCPNPEAGYQSDSINTANTAGYHGVFASQTLVTADKLDIARSVEWQDVEAAKYELRRVEIDLATAVRENYFQALIAQERLKFARGLADLFQETYEGQIELVAGGEAAAYEPLQLRVFAVQAQNDAIQAGNAYVAAWRQLAAVLNAPHLTARELDGSPEMPVPEISYEAALEIMLTRHTELAIARTKITRGELDLSLQQRTPIPNINLEGVMQYDDTSPLNDTAFNVRVGLPLPIFDRNQGNIYTAESQLVENHNQLTATQNDLAAQLAEAYARYTTNRLLADNFRNQIIPDQVRTYRGTYQRYREGADNMDFAQIVTSQQQMGQVIRDYVVILGNQWQAVVDLAELLQADDLYSLDQPAGLPGDVLCPPNSLRIPAPIPDDKK